MVKAALGVGPHRTRGTCRRSAAALAAFALSLTAPTLSIAQTAPPTAGFPPPPPAQPAQPAPQPAAPAQPAPQQPPVQSPPAGGQTGAAPASGQPPPPPTGPPPPVYQAAPSAPAYAQPQSAPPPPPAYGSQPAIVEPPPPPPPKPQQKGLLWPPPWSVRLDPFTLIFYGHLNIELEVGLLKWLSVELVPQFVTSETPPLWSGFNDRADYVRQASNGWGPLSGTSIGAGFWLQGKPLEGYVLRAIFTNYGYTYQSYGANGVKVDEFSHTARVLMAMFGSNSTFGVFTIAGGIGLGVDLNNQHRCYPAGANSIDDAQPSGCDTLQLALDPSVRSVGIVSSSIYPAVIAARISLGVTFK